MSDRDTDTGTPDTLTPEAFSPAGAAPTREQLAATAFEPLSQASEQRRRINITQIVLGVAGVLVVALLFFLFTARTHPLAINEYLCLCRFDGKTDLAELRRQGD